MEKRPTIFPLGPCTQICSGPSPHQCTLLGFISLPPRPPFAVALFASAGLKCLSPPRVRGNGRRSDHSDDPILWWIVAPARAGQISLMIAGQLLSLTVVSLCHPSSLLFLPSNTDKICCAPFLDGRNEKADSVPALDHPSKWIDWTSGMGCEGTNTISSAVVVFKFY